jgi:hypothetical protein
VAARPRHESPYPPSPGRSPPGLVGRARNLREAFDALWPPLMAVVGLVMIGAFAIVPSLRNPGLIAAISGMFTIVSTIGLARRESK